MIKAPINLQDLRQRIYRKAKSDKTHRFWGLFVHITKIETLEEAYRIAKSNGGAASPDFSPPYWQKAAFHGITEFPHSS